MNFNSLQYYIFLPASIFLYFLAPAKWCNAVLLILSYFFYMCWNPQYAFLILTSTVITYLCGVFIDKNRQGKKLYLVASLLLNLSILFFFKYYNFFGELTEQLFSAMGVGIAPPYLNLLLPVGISFYTFQALGYTMDVYRGDIKAENNFITYALFVSFFPQLVAGPIERSGNLLPQLRKKSKFSGENIKIGILPILWGLFKKMVIADRLAVIANTVYLGEGFSGIQYMIATVCFAFQIYCDFSAYSDIARGSAKMLGIELMVNFKAPYFAQSVKDFWRRWHISLSSWFKDYLYFPLGGSRCSTFRGCINLLVVFAVSGLWHGAALTFVVWGLLNGFYQVIAILLAPFRDQLASRLPRQGKGAVYSIVCCGFTFMLICLSWVFFRAESIGHALSILKSIAAIPFDGTVFPLGISRMGLTRGYLIVAALSVFILLLVDFISQYTDVAAILNKKFALRYASYFLLLAAIIVFGYYGMGYDPQDFIYFQF